MATTNAQIDISVNGLEKLDKLQTGLNTVTSKFSGFKTMIAGLGVAALGKSILQMADDLQDLSNSTGIATARLIEFKKALTVSGGQAEAMPNAINQFIRSIDEAAQGSVKAQNSFAELGISINDLRTQSEQQLLGNVLKGIAAIEDPARRAGLMMEYFGKSFKTVDPRELNDRLTATAGSADKYAESLKRAAELNDQLATAQGTLKLAFLETFSPVLGLLVNFNKSIEEGKASIDTLVTVMKVLATAVAVAFAFTAVGAAVRIIGTIGRGVGSLISLFGGMGTAVSSVFRATGPVMTALRGVGGAIAAIGAGIATVLGLSKDTGGGAGAGRGGQGGPTAEELKKYNAEQKAAADEAARQRDVDTKARDNAIRQVRDITSEYQKQNKFSLERLNLETELIGKSDEEKASRQAQFDLMKQFTDLQDSLIKKRDTLSKEEQYLVPLYNEQLKAVEALYKTQSKSLDEILSKQMLANYAEKERQNTIDQINKSLERQAIYGDQLVAANDKLKQIEFEGKIEGLNDVQKQIARINEEARLGALQAGRAIAATYEGLDLSAEQSAELARKLEEVQKRYKGIADQQIGNLQQSRTFASGWKKAFQEYSDSAKNASENARNFFNKTLSGMEDLIVNFAKTGKFEWKSFVASMAEELLRSQIRQSFASIMEGMSNSMGGGGIMDTISGLLGFGGGSGSTKGQSANNPLYVIDIAGGGAGGGAFGGGGGVFGGGQPGGGGIFSGISNVFSGITDTISNIGSSIGNVFSGISDSVGSIFGGGGGGGGGFFDSITSGIGSLFDGFFANGGNIGAGKFGIVGERGPEFVGGPASVTPMGMGGSVTYNINAVDAASFKALVAADPGFIHAVAMAGANSIPGRR
jgi:lambda family phage tail tape measure protein